MKKFTAILLITVFAFAQYAKQALYLECKLSNNFKFATEKCDCNKISGLDKPDPGQPLSKTHTHIHLDEFFPVARQTFFDLEHYSILMKFYFPGNEDECEGISVAPYHPPRC